MNKFIDIPIVLPGDENKVNEDKDIIGKIDPNTIVAYHDGYYWGSCIYTTHGSAFMSRCTAAEIGIIIDNHEKQNT